jgi:hypothetical protein
VDAPPAATNPNDPDDPIAIAMRGLRADGVAFVFAFLLAFFFAIYGHSDEAAAKNDALSFKRFG